jgi:hypothetical protein
VQLLDAEAATCALPADQVIDLKKLKRTVLPERARGAGRSTRWRATMCGWRTRTTAVAMKRCCGERSVCGKSMPTRPPAVSLSNDALLVLATRRLTFQAGALGDGEVTDDVTRVTGSVVLDGPSVVQVAKNGTATAEPHPELAGLDSVDAVFDDRTLLLSGPARFALLRAQPAIGASSIDGKDNRWIRPRADTGAADARREDRLR